VAGSAKRPIVDAELKSLPDGWHGDSSPKACSARGRTWADDTKTPGAENSLGLGSYPTVSLKEARLKRNDTSNGPHKETDPHGRQQGRKERERGSLDDRFEELAVNRLPPAALEPGFKDNGRQAATA
jgi:hypothetical protein